MQIWERVKKLVARKNFGSDENTPKSSSSSSINWSIDPLGNLKLLEPVQYPIYLTTSGFISNINLFSSSSMDFIDTMVNQYMQEDKELELLTKIFRGIRKYKEENKCDY